MCSISLRKLKKEHSDEILYVKPLESSCPAWMRSVLPHDQAIKWKMQKYVFTQIQFYVWDRWMKANRSNNKMGRTSGRIQDVSSLQRIVWNRWRSNWIRVEYFPRIFVIADSSRDPSGIEKNEHRTSRVHGPGHLHVFVQRHRLDREEKWWDLYFECRKSRITRWDPCKDTGRFWIVDRKRSDMENPSTHSMESGTPQPVKCCNCSNKLVIPCSKSIVALIKE